MDVNNSEEKLVAPNSNFKPKLGHDAHDGEVQKNSQDKLPISISHSAIHHHHRHKHPYIAAVVHEIKLLLVFLLIYVLVEFTLIFFDLLNERRSDLLFTFIILKSTFVDLAYGPQNDKIYVVKAKICFLTKLIICLFAGVFCCGCFTNQFMVQAPVELQVLQDGSDHHIEETLAVWRWTYKGFNFVYDLENVNVPKQSFFGFNLTESVDTNGYTNDGSEGMVRRMSNINVQASMLHAVIHVIVCASKIAVVRFVLLEWELTIKMVSRLSHKI